MTKIDPGAGEDRPFSLKCGCCAHVWEAGRLPMPVIAWASLLHKSTCPRCGAGSQHLKLAPEVVR